ncbi:MAG TPA: selenocysteine-specific translation elongation factor, partial [Planctomycetota bacterium]|nr:selenocysteine-specific translation elongation factor [Planctomycetota bacterium]
MTTRQINVTLGTAGHVDHGKTALVKLFTGCETDRLKEEKERGLSIELGFAPCTIGELEVGIVDVPGHEHFVKTMVAGASGMDGVILVVAADDGVMLQTREHLDIMTLLGITHGIVALTKVDIVTAGRVEEVRRDLAEFTRGTFLEGAPVLPVSSVTGEGFGPFLSALNTLVASIEPKSTTGVFRLPAERSFSVRGYGTVVSGIPITGSVRLGDEVVLLPQGETGRINAVQVYGRDSDVARSGQCAALNVRHWDHKTIGRGNVVATPGYFEPAGWYVLRLRLLEHEGLFLRNGTGLKFHTGTSEQLATLYLLEDDTIRAGQEQLAEVRLDEPLIAGPNDPF